MPLSKVKKINIEGLRPHFITQARRLKSIRRYQPISELSTVLARAGVRHMIVDERAKLELELHGDVCCREIVADMKIGRSLYEVLMTHLHDRGLEATLREPTTKDTKGVDLIIVGSEENKKIILKDGCGIVSPPNLLEGIGISQGIVISKVRMPVGETDYIEMRGEDIKRIGQRSIAEEISEINNAFDRILEYYQILESSKKSVIEKDAQKLGEFTQDAVDSVTSYRSKMTKLLGEGAHPVLAAQELLLRHAHLKDSEDEKMRDIYVLLKGILNRVLSKRYGSGGGWLRDIIDGNEGVILAAEDIDPTSAAEIVAKGKDKIIGMATEAGGKVTHLTVIAMGLSIPAVSGLKNLTENVKIGDTLLIDGLRGVVFVNPTQEQTSAYQTRIKCYKKAMSVLGTEKGKSPVTIDGKQILLGVNVESALEANMGIEQNVNAGVVLVRTEYPESIDADGRARVREASMEERAAYIDAIARPYKEKGLPAVFRTIDITKDKKLQFVETMQWGDEVGTMQYELFEEPSGLPLALKHPVYRMILKNQIRDFLAAQYRHGNIEVMLPNPFSFDQLKQVREIIRGAKEELAAKKINYADFPLGIMVENISMINALEEAESSEWHRLKSVKPAFLSIGTNDLTSSVLGVDRYDASVADLYDEHHPKVLRQILRVHELGKMMGVPVSVCGNMPSNIIGLAVLLGIGIDKIGLAAGSLELGTHFVRNSTNEHAQEIVNGIWDITHPEEVRRYVAARMDELITKRTWSIDRNIFDFFAGYKK